MVLFQLVDRHAKVSSSKKDTRFKTGAQKVSHRHIFLEVRGTVDILRFEKLMFRSHMIMNAFCSYI